jgi:uncharacterized membrane protein YhaH (DUF805 family)/tetratricopeptide (TPR) repeat protein
MVLLNKMMAGDPELAKWCWATGPSQVGFWFWTVYAVVIPLLGLFLPNGKTVCATYLLMLMGLSFYLYMPIASDQNPPINWGYPRTWEGFMHAITRGQYERVTLTDVFSRVFVEQVGAFLNDLQAQFFEPVAFLGVIPFAFIPFFGKNGSLCYRRRINRLTYFVWFNVWALFLSVVALALYPAGGVSSLIVFILTCILSLVLMSFPVINRLHDLGLSGFFSWVMLIPGVNLVFQMYLFLKKGTKGLNPYGDDPLDGYDGEGDNNRIWIFTTVAAFIGVGILFIILQNPKIDMQTLFIARVQYIQSHAVYAIWIGYGLLLMMAWLQALVRNNFLTKWVGTALVFLLPFSLIYKNYFNEKQLKYVGGSEQNGHDFGWQFGNWQLRGVEGIKDDLWYYCGKDQAKFDAEWAKYPNPAYPPPMGTNALFFGGTDPGRFVPTYMIYCPQVRPDVYLITQNALADGTFMAVTRDLYGDQLWIPSPEDSNRAFQEFVQGVQAGRIDAGADVKMEGGRVQVTGVGGVMQINGILCRQIFDHNQYVTELKTDESTRQSGAAVVPFDPVGPDGKMRRREFFVEESYVIHWMYPYLTPHGIIMKLNNEPTEITPEIVKNDRDFWDWYVNRLVSDSKFIRDIVARKTFSKLRSAIAGLYVSRGNMAEAEYAFKQAVQLYPISPEAVFRLAELYMRQKRFDDAGSVVSRFMEQDEHNDGGKALTNQIEQLRKMDARKCDLEVRLRSGTALDINEALELLQIYNAFQDYALFDQLVGTLLNSEMPQNAILQMAQVLAQIKRYPSAELVLKKYLGLQPNDFRIQIELAALQMGMGHPEFSLGTIKQAVERGGEPVRALLRKDQRFQPLWNDARFQELVPLSVERKFPLKGFPDSGGFPAF